MRKAFFSALVCVASAAMGTAAVAQTAAPNFSGKTITLVNGYAPGSGNDVFGRLVAQHLGKQLPGQPKVVQQNMPGAGSFKAANYIYNVAPKDGTVIGYIAQTAATEELLGNPAVQFKAAKFGWVGRISSYNIVTTTWHTSRVRTIEDAKKIETTAGATGAGSTVYIYPNAMNKVLGTKFKIVSGYEGTGQTALAMERGEVEGVSMGWFTIKSQKKDWLDEKKINVLVQFLSNRHADLPDVPTIVELARTTQERQLFQMFANEGEIGKAILAPPGLPAPALATLRKAFTAMTKDPEFIAEADRIQVERAPMEGEKLQTLIEAAAGIPPAVVAQAKMLLK